MSAIMRWFYHDARRYRAWFRYSEDPDRRELVVAGPGLETAVREPVIQALEELSDERLVEIARHADGNGGRR